MAGTEEMLLVYGQISFWDTSSVTDMSGVFYDDRCEHGRGKNDFARFTTPLTSWDVSNVT